MKLMILDGNSIVNRAYYGVRLLNAPDGTPTNAIYGFIAILQRLLDEQKPEAVCVCFDLKAPTFRHKQYDGYKAQRKGMPDELAVQMPLLKETLDAMGIRRYELEGYEADDLLGTAAAICERTGWDCVIVTGDKDSLQLISDTTTVCNVKTRMGQTETILYTPERFKEEYGFEPKLMVDLKALMGDSSDNIPGVPGIGEKTAMSLVQSYGEIKNIYAKLDELDIKDGVRKKLSQGQESADMSYWLATIVRDAPVEFKPEDNIWDHNYTDNLYTMFKRLGFNKFIEKWGLEASPETPSVGTYRYLPRREINSTNEVEKLIADIKAAEYIAVYPLDKLDRIELCDGQAVYGVAWNQCGDGYNKLLHTLFVPDVKKLGHNVKDFMGLLLEEQLSTEGFTFDTALAAYLLDATESSYDLERMSVGNVGAELTGAEAVMCCTPY
jgi:DNA polymerase-1